MIVWVLAAVHGAAVFTVTELAAGAAGGGSEVTVAVISAVGAVAVAAITALAGLWVARRNGSRSDSRVAVAELQATVAHLELELERKRGR